MKNKLAAWIVLGLIAVVAAVCLSVTNEITKDVIDAQNKAAAEAAWQALVPGADFPDAEQAEEGAEGYVYAGYVDGEVAGYVAQVTVTGYAGDVEIIVGTDAEGTLSGISVGGANFQETAGLGAKAKESAFTDQFAGLTAPIVLGENVDAITAATITSSAVVRGVNTAVEKIAEKAGFEIAGGAEGGALGDGRYSATVRGFAGPVYVEIQLDDAGVITDIVIGNDEFAETAGYGLKAKEPAFYEQFVGKSDSVELGVDVDAIAGATITSQAVVDAVNLALLTYSDPETAAASGTVEPFVMPEIPNDAVTETGSARGFAGPVDVSLTMDKDGTEILMLEIGSDQWAETEGFGSRALEDTFWQQFIGLSLPVGEDDIDMLAGATVTSKAVIGAVNAAYEKLFPQGNVTLDDGAAHDDPNTATASAKGFEGPVAITLTVDEAYVITAFEVGDGRFAETAGFGAKALEPEFAEQFIGMTLPLDAADVDMISGATITSRAVIEAVNAAYEEIEARQSNAGETDTEDANTATGSAQGFEGPVAVTITVDESGAVSAITIGDDAFSETAGFGAKAKEPAFYEQFIGKTPPVSEDDVDMISGATITSRAVIEAVNAAYEEIEARQGNAGETEGPEDQATESEKPESWANASKRGYAGPVYVEITVDEAGALASVSIGNDRFSETEGFGAKALEPAFAERFIGLVPPLSPEDIDVIAGATVTTEAVVAAINEAYAKLELAVGETEGGMETRFANASKRGYAGPVYVEITVDEAGALASVVIGNDRFAETEGFGAKALEPTFAERFIGLVPPLSPEDIDVIAGATVTTEAVLAAINEAYEKLGK